MRQRSRPAVPDDAAVVENLLKLGGGIFALSGRQIRLSANVGGIEAGNVGGELRSARTLWAAQRLQSIQGLSRVLPGSAPLAPESLAAKAIASACPADSACSSLAPTIRLVHRIARHGIGQCGFSSRLPDLLEQASKPLAAACRASAALPNAASRWAAIACQIAPFSLLSARTAESTARLVSFSRLSQMTGIRLGVGCRAKVPCSHFGLAREPLLLFRHRRGVRCRGRPERRERCVNTEVIAASARCASLNHLPRFVESLQGEQEGRRGCHRRYGRSGATRMLALSISAAFSYCPCCGVDGRPNHCEAPVDSRDSSRSSC